jgi:DtxR family Mn-dependent transcriptional regulator
MVESPEAASPPEGAAAPEAPRWQGLTESLQDYLEAVYLAAEEHGVARMKEIAARVGVATPSATGAVQALAERGLVHYDPYQYVTLTEKGEQAGRDLVRRHRALKAFLVQVLGVAAEEAETVGCEMEHAIKGEVLERFVQFLEFVEGEGGRQGSLAESFAAFRRRRAAPEGPARDAAGPAGGA